TITAYLPPPGKATSTGVIIAPGGAFVALAIDLEAREVARWLQERGIAAFVLKYRTMEKLQEGIPEMDMDEAGQYGIADGIEALKSAGHRPEAHIFSAGGHGFGMQKKGSSSDHWIDEFYYWLEAQGFARVAGK